MNETTTRMRDGARRGLRWLAGLSLGLLVAGQGACDVDVMKKARGGDCDPTKEDCGGVLSGDDGGPAIRGRAMRGGPLASAEVTVNAVNDDGSDGAALGKATTGPTGRFRVKLGAQPKGAVRVTVTGGAHVSLWDERPIYSGPGKNPMSLHLDEAPPADEDVFVTPVSDLVAGVVRGKDAPTALPQAAAKARELVAKLFGFTGDPKPLFERTGPGLTCDPSATTGDLVCRGDLLRLWLLSIALEKTAFDLFPDNRDVLYVLLAQDLDDGVFDGKRKAAPQVVYDKYTLPREAGGKILASNCKTWYPPLQSADFKAAMAKAGGAGSALKDAAMTTLDGMGQGLRVAAMGADGLKADLPIYKSHGGQVAAWVNGRLWLYLPTAFRGVASIDITDPSARTRETKLWDNVIRKGWPEYYDSKGLLNTAANSPAPASGGILGVVPLYGADHPQLAVYSQGPRLVFINAETGVIEGSQELPLTVNNAGIAGAPLRINSTSAILGSFSDGENGFWVWNIDGYFYFDARTRTMNKESGFSMNMKFPYGNLGATSTAYYSDYPIIDLAGGRITQTFKYLYRDSRNLLVPYSGIFQIDMKTKKTYFADSLTMPLFEPELSQLPTQNWSPMDTCYDSVSQTIFAPYGVVSPLIQSRAGLLDVSKATRMDGDPGRLTFPPESMRKTDLDFGQKGTTTPIPGPARGACLIDPNTRRVLFHSGEGAAILNADGTVSRSWVSSGWGAGGNGLASIVYNRNTGKAYGYTISGVGYNGNGTIGGSIVYEIDIDQYLDYVPLTNMGNLQLSFGSDLLFVKSFKY